MVNGAAYTRTSKFGGYAMNFDGTNDFINTSDITGPTDMSAGNFSITAWVKTTETAPQAIVAKGKINSPAQGYGLFQTSTSNFLRFTIGDGTTELESRGTKYKFNDGKWHFVTGTANITNNKMTISVYVDGNLDIQQDNGVSSINSITNTNFAATIGAYHDPSIGTFFNGQIDEVAIWNRTLSSNEITNLYLWR